MEYMENLTEYVEKQASLCQQHDVIDKELYARYGVKRGLRDENGQGVLTGLTNISQIIAFKDVDGQKVPCDGQLLYRGYDVQDLVKGGKGKRHIFEEAAYLLLFGELPTEAQLSEFSSVIAESMNLPTNFTRDVIMKAPSVDIMNSMTRSVLTLASYDNHYENDGSMYIHRPDKDASVAENILRMLRPDMKYTELEARVLDIALLLHMEHGGGNNSTFTTRVVTSSGSDTYSAIAAALSSLKGRKHGGANLQVMNMMDDIKEHIKDYHDEEAIEAYLDKLLNKQAYDHKGLIYGMGHAVYSLSDPREKVFKSFVEQLAAAKGRDEDMTLYNNIEKIAPKLIAKERKIYKGVSPNVDFYSGFVYEMLGIPRELYTPLFAVARIVGWSAHRIEELVTTDKIIRPAYKSLVKYREYVDRDAR